MAGLAGISRWAGAAGLVCGIQGATEGLGERGEMNSNIAGLPRRAGAVPKHASRRMCRAFAKQTALGLLAALLSAVMPAVAAVPVGSGFTYQGQLLDAGLPAQGTYEISATLHDAPVGGSPVAGPILVTNVQLAAGLFTAVLDFGLPAYGTEVRWLELAIRRVGDATFVTLAPRQELTPTPFAIRADTSLLAAESLAAPWSGLADVPAGFADGVDNDLLAGITCGDGDVAGRVAGAWTCLAPGTVREVAAGPGLSGGPISNIGTLRVAVAGIQSEMLAAGAVGSEAVSDGAIGAVDVNTSEVQRRVLGNCAVGKAIVGIGSDGTVTCADVQVPLRPQRLGPPEVPTVATGSRMTTTTAGRPAIFYGTATATAGAICSDTACQGSRTLTGSLLGTAYELAATRTGGDRPLIAAVIPGLSAVAAARCADAACTGFGAWQSLYSGSATLGKNGIDARPGTPPVVVFARTFGFQVVRCSTDDCNQISGTSGPLASGAVPAVAISATGLPIIAAKTGDSTVSVFECATTDCASLVPGGTISTGLDNIGVGIGIADAGPGGAYVAFGTVSSRLYLAHCTGTACASQTLVRIANSSVATSTVDIAIGANGLPVISFVRALGDYDLVVVSCLDSSCSRSIRSVLESGADSYLQETDLVVPEDGLPVIMVNGQQSNDPPIILKCSTPTCG